MSRSKQTKRISQALHQNNQMRKTPPVSRTDQGERHSLSPDSPKGVIYYIFDQLLKESDCNYLVISG